MALIAICVWSMASEINGTLKLSRTWSQAGHRICYVGVPDCRPIVSDNGFEFVSVLERWLPAGSIDDKSFYHLPRVAAWRRAAHMFRRKRRFERVLTEVLQNRHNDIEETFQRLKPDLVIIGTHTPHTHIFGFVAARLRIRCAYLTQQMIQSPAARVVPQPSPWRRRYSLKEMYRRATFRLLNINYPRFFNAFLEMTGLPPQSLNYGNGRYPLRAPILYPWPTPFELPGIIYSNVLPIETGVQLDRHEDTTFLDSIPQRSALIYCSFGTLLPLGLGMTRALLDKVIESMRSIPDVQMVMAVGPYFDVSEFKDLPANVALCRSAPQMSALKRSDMVITNGGSASTPECLLLGIPMIVIPLGFESAEYAKRVSYHQLGFGADHRTLSVSQLSAMIQSLLRDTKYKQAAMRMKAALEDWESRKPSLAALDICLGAQSTPEYAIAIP